MNLAPQRTTVLRIALDTPLSARSASPVQGEGAPAEEGTEEGLLDYIGPEDVELGQRVLAPFGKQLHIGLVVATAVDSPLPAERLRPVHAVLTDIPPLGPAWLALMRFAARYYQRTLGEVALPALPALLRRAEGYRAGASGWESRSIALLKKRAERARSDRAQVPEHPDGTQTEVAPNADQARAIALLQARLNESRFACELLYGVTGSGKTEVYLAAVATALARGRQVLVLVPEINLTPQLESRFRARFPERVLASLHSGMADGERAAGWLLAHEGSADIVLGTRMAVLASLPRLGLIVVDEEHDPSFKQQEGLRYSARDLAIVRAQAAGIPVVLASATPSLESWYQAERGRYERLALPERAAATARLPAVELIDMTRVPAEHGISEPLWHALSQNLEQSEQSLVFLNRRGYAPVLSCNACGWVSDCKRCSVHAVYHKSDRLLHCHHCGWQARVPVACPQCGNADLIALGRGTQRIEETLAAGLPAARIVRIDRDSTRRRGSGARFFEQVHRQEVDILVGTQMVAKGHDFQHLTLVGVLDADAALFSHDFRAPERLFANLMQVAGRAGRAAQPGRVMVQTRFPSHPLFEALKRHDYPGFAREALGERRAAGLPPFSFQAIVRAEARTIERALEFLGEAAERARSLLPGPAISIYDPVPMTLVRVAHVERAQLLVESPSRPALQQFLRQWSLTLHAQKARVRWHMEVDPLDI